jgi:hypothetical protein
VEKICKLIAGVALTFGLTGSASAVIVQIEFALDAGAASIDPFTLPNPNGGEDFTVSPQLTVSSGSFIATFDSDRYGNVLDGAASIGGFNIDGEIDIELATTIVLGPFPVPVSANLIGPLSSEQVDDSTGSLIGLTSYLETDLGTYDTAAGPLDCGDSAFGLVCGGLETGLGITFPLAEISTPGAALPFSGGMFSQLSNPGSATAGTTIEFSVPVNDTTDIGFEVDFTWQELSRIVVIPEPGSGLLALIGTALVFARRRR